MTRLTRRRFLTLTGSLVVTGCTARAGSTLSGPTSVAHPDAVGTTPTTRPADVTAVVAPTDAVPGDRAIVMVELNGGNDAVNTSPPPTGTYHDLRPTLALPEAHVLTPAGLAGHGLHPSLAALVPYIDDGRLATVAGVGFPDPDRSHFVSTDRWMYADRMDETLGWLGRWLDTLPADLPALGATSLGSGGKMLLGADRGGTVIDQVDAFAFPSSLGNASIRALAEPPSDDPLIAAAQRAFATSVGAVEEFDAVADAVRERVDDSPEPYATTGAFTTGLAVAAELIAGGPDTRLVTVTGGGFDTHGEQLDVHAALLEDLARGLDGFWRTLDEAGAADRVLLVTHSEFGRRVAENASGGCDHGAAGVSFVMATQ